MIYWFDDNRIRGLNDMIEIEKNYLYINVYKNMKLNQEFQHAMQ